MKLGHNMFVKCFVKLALAAFLLSATTTIAQNNKDSVSVTHTGTDNIGKQFAYAIRESIRASRSFRLTPVKDASLQIFIITLDPDPERVQSPKGSWAVASVTYAMRNNLPFEKGNPQTWYPIFLTSEILTIGSKRVDEQAKGVVVILDEQLEKYRSDMK